MANKIQFKRGPGAPAVGVLDVGEPGFDLTNKKLYIGTGITETPVLINEDPEVYADDAAMEVMRELLNADTLGGYPASDYATQTFVTNKIAEAQLSGGDIDLSGLVSKDELNTLAAPVGYGYGESLVGLGNANDDATFTAALSEQFAKTANKTRQFYFTYGGVAFLGKLWNAGNNYGVLIATSYAEPNVGYRFKQLVRVCTNGTWGAWVDNSPAAFAPTSHKHDFLVDVGSSSYRPGMQYSGSPTNPTYIAAWEYNQSANGTQPNVLVRAIEAEKARALIGAVGYKLLWENANPASAFAEQTISLNLSDYSQVLVYFRVYNGTGEYSSETFGVHGLVGSWCMAVCNSETGSNPSQRAFQITNTGIKFSLAYYATSIGGALTWSSNLLIPTKIYGIKGVS